MFVCVCVSAILLFETRVSILNFISRLRTFLVYISSLFLFTCFSLCERYQNQVRWEDDLFMHLFLLTYIYHSFMYSFMYIYSCVWESSRVCVNVFQGECVCRCMSDEGAGVGMIGTARWTILVPLCCTISRQIHKINEDLYMIVEFLS